jgi:hypothetical protein
MGGWMGWVDGVMGGWMGWVDGVMGLRVDNIFGYEIWI